MYCVVLVCSADVSTVHATHYLGVTRYISPLLLVAEPILSDISMALSIPRKGPNPLCIPPILPWPASVAVGGLSATVGGWLGSVRDLGTQGWNFWLTAGGLAKSRLFG